MSFNQEQVNQILELERQMKEASNAFVTALDAAGYVTVWTGSYEDTRRYKVHPAFVDEVEGNSEFMGLKQEWLDTLPPGIVFEP